MHLRNLCSIKPHFHGKCGNRFYVTKINVDRNHAKIVFMDYYEEENMLRLDLSIETNYEH